jgi:hypothetical protein
LYAFLISPCGRSITDDTLTAEIWNSIIREKKSKEEEETLNEKELVPKINKRTRLMCGRLFSSPS